MVITSVRDVKLEPGYRVTHTKGRICQHEKMLWNNIYFCMDTVHRQRWVMPTKLICCSGDTRHLTHVGSRVAIADVDRHDGDSSAAVKRQGVCDNVTALDGHV